MLNRSLLLLRYKQPFVDWINAADPEPDPQGPITLDEANAEGTAYLVEVEDEEELQDWLALNATTLFEEELEGWFNDPELWPRERSLERLAEWCDFELHSVVRDTGGAPLVDDELEDEGT